MANLPGEGINESESVGGGVGGDYDWIVEDDADYQQN